MSYAALSAAPAGQYDPMSVGWYYVYAKMVHGVWHPGGWSWGRTTACATTQTIWPDVRVAVWGYSEQKWIYDGPGAGCH